MRGYTTTIFGTIHGRTITEILQLYVQYQNIGIGTVGLSCRLDPVDVNFDHPNEAYRKSVVRAKIVDKLYQYHTLYSFRGLQMEHHLLGMNHPAELTFYRRYGNMIRSCDSSAAFINGYLRKQVDVFDYEKPEVKMDFNLDFVSPFQALVINDNIDTLIKWSKRQ